MSMSIKKNLAAHGPWDGSCACLLQGLLRSPKECLEKAWVSPNGDSVRVFNGSPAVDGQVADIVDREPDRGCWALDGSGGNMRVF